MNIQAVSDILIRTSPKRFGKYLDLIKVTRSFTRFLYQSMNFSHLSIRKITFERKPEQGSYMKPLTKFLNTAVRMN